MDEFKADGHEFRTSVADVVMVMVVFHSCEFDWILGRDSPAEHFGHDEDYEGPEKASAAEEINQGVTSGGKHGQYYQCGHR